MNPYHSAAAQALTMPASERQPLLKNGPSSCQVVDDDVKSVRAGMDVVRRPGPLDITAASRHRILVGIWLAQFLSVRAFASCYFSSLEIFAQGIKLFVASQIV